MRNLEIGTQSRDSENVQRNLEIVQICTYSQKVDNEYYATYYLLTLGGSTDTAGLSAEGITGYVLLIFTEVLSLLVWAVVVFAAATTCISCRYCACARVVDYDLPLTDCGIS